jgi:hypothetical protein
MSVRFAVLCSAAAALLASALTTVAAGPAGTAAATEPPLVTSTTAHQKSLCTGAAAGVHRQKCFRFAVRLAHANRDTNQMVALTVDGERGHRPACSDQGRGPALHGEP